ncbi:hypothetical protein J5N97_021301 [Dioscorea zingiberensis]|uniref:Homeobox domain-containing protein n=1 Tax=Dioscorea zingiberensis TaxID=325984 RepID=A0A9D5CHE7_9LILI|nr:hypothetical protein J5N97_021301 [Dioscorea zingiberensis]
MATFFHGAPEIQSDSLQTLQFMNPGFAGYSDTPAPNNMVLLNSNMSSLNPVTYSQAQHHFVGIPLQSSTQEAANPHEISTIHGFMPRLHYNLWTPTSANNNTIDISTSTMPLAQQGSLSLSLSSQQAPYNHYHSESEVPTAVPEITPVSSVSFNGGMSSSQSTLMSSKYLKVAQQLLDEVANLGKGTVERDQIVKGGSSNSKSPKNKSSNYRDSEEGETSVAVKRGVDLTTVEKQELQMKKAKLVTMLDEVEQRYRQYSQQMQIVVSSFEVVAGPGSARTYTSLALQTISKQFRSLRDTIVGQIRGVSKSLGEEECLVGSKAEGSSRLRFVDHQLRQQRALQQLGMMQHNAWRPQRGLPERSVSVLRAWLFEHFLHPYPKDSDKIMLAKQTGLSRSQVSNWFINARVRLWKPMVEEMYLEETKEQEQNNGDDHKANNKSIDANENSTSKSGAQQDNSPTRTEQDDNRKPSPMSVNILQQAIYQDSEVAAMHHKLKKPRTDEMNHGEFLDKFSNGRPVSGEHGYSMIAGNMNHGGSFGGYQVGEFERFEGEPFAQRFSGNGVALTLGLSHCENLSMSGGQQQTYIPFGRRLEMSSSSSSNNNNNNNNINNNNQGMGLQTNGYENMNLQSRKRMAAQLLPDFVS